MHSSHSVHIFYLCVSSNSGIANPSELLLGTFPEFDIKVGLHKSNRSDGNLPLLTLCWVSNIHPRKA